MIEIKEKQQVQSQEPISSGVEEGVLILNEDGRIAYADETSAKLLEYESADLLGHHQDEFWSNGALPYDGITPDSGYSFQAALRQKNGRSLPALVTITPLTKGENAHQLISLMRLSDVEEINTIMWHTQRLAGIGMLASSVAHELTNPISIITATCSNLKLDIQNNALSTTQLLNYVQMIEQSAWRSVRIMEVLRNYTLNNDPQTAVTDLNIILEDAMTLVKQQFHKEHNVTICAELDENLKSIVCDHNRIVQVAINLLTNGRDAMPESGGEIVLKSWAVPMEKVRESEGGNANEQYAFSVTDNGAGVPAELLDKLFQPFFTTKANRNGTGLGLFISKGIVTQHNGRIQVTNNPNGGTTFTVILPRQ